MDDCLFNEQPLVGGSLLMMFPLKVVMLLNASALILTAILYFCNKSIYGLETVTQIQPVTNEALQR
ncbi:hypothetical protein IV487_06845 [Enterococcus saccharolyticus]|uniref:hypothetical protein n=1 Tax=Enterococcus saccharolyticus TaxID=41997 RepID=UPI001E65487E|nr:hypothetical protein [Enterococcus saccharolyticus]MCD5002197.1 hypothetical protein [Enterococcus saccharolyticus]